MALAQSALSELLDAFRASTSSVDDLVEAMAADAEISKSEVSRICAGLDETVGAFRTRTLDHTEFLRLPGRDLPRASHRGERNR